MADVNTPSSIAPLKNVTAMMSMIKRLQDRPNGLEAFGVFSGYPGLGKTIAASYARNKARAIYLEIGSTWTKKDFLKKLLIELDEPNGKGTLTDLVDRAIGILAGDPDQVILLDEADRLLDRKIIEIVRDLHDKLQIPVILVGEERLPMKLGAPEFERVHSRVLEWTLAQPCDLDDGRYLADFLVPKVEITDELLSEIIRQTRGNARRIATTLYQVEAAALQSGAQQMSPSTYSGPIHTGEAPTRYRRKDAA
ncbi:MAG: ATP-binding protein [Pseudomonadota bacterium]